MGYGFVIAVVVVAVLLAWNGVKIVREYQRLVVFRLGRSFGPRGPGLVYLIPIIDKAVWVDLREAFLEIPARYRGLQAGCLMAEAFRPSYRWGRMLTRHYLPGCQSDQGVSCANRRD